MTTSFNWKIAGAAGEGVKSSGLIFTKACAYQGYSVHGYDEYPSLIRGGHNTFQTHVCTTDSLSLQFQIDVLVALNENGLKNHQAELKKSSFIISSKNFPFTEIIKKAQALPQMKNIATLGASAFVLGIKLENLNQSITENFKDKDKTVIDLNLKVAQLGYDYAQDNFADKKTTLDSSASSTDNQLISGNDALALGAIAGGLKLYIAYPMTPATSILHFLSAKSKQANLAVRHGEDEIGVINMAIGASFAGARSMVATSGGGFSLMTEGLGLSGVTETPLVIVNSMRPGPASGMPTWTGQGDLLYVINASQDEFPRIVFTPGDAKEAFDLSKLAQNMAEKYQLPVIILIDKYLSASYFTVKKFDSKHQNQRYGFANTKTLDNLEPFPRYQDSETGISPRTIPGQAGGVHLTNSYEHDEYGFATEEASSRTKQVNKRAKKIKYFLEDPSFINPILLGPQNAQNTLISWGSNKGIVQKALESLPNTNFIHFPLVWPFPKQGFLKLVESQNNLITLEQNHDGQLNKLIRQETGLEIKNQLLKYDGRPFFPQEIIDHVQKSH